MHFLIRFEHIVKACLNLGPKMTGCQYVTTFFRHLKFLRIIQIQVDCLSLFSVYQRQYFINVNLSRIFFKVFLDLVWGLVEYAFACGVLQNLTSCLGQKGTIILRWFILVVSLNWKRSSARLKSVHFKMCPCINIWLVWLYKFTKHNLGNRLLLNVAKL